MALVIRQRLTFPISFIILVLPPAVDAQKQPAAPSWVETRAEMEAFLSKATIMSDSGPPADARRSWRVRLEDGNRKHDAAVETADGSDPTRRDYRFNVAAYELDKALGLHLIPPSVERLVSGRPASLIWITDHTGGFRIRRQLENPESLTRCDSALLRRLRELHGELLQRTLGKYLSFEQLDALEGRRKLLVKHFDEQIARKGEAAVLYDLPTRQ